MTLVLGVDGGGTGCRAAIARPSGEILGTGHGGPANIRTDPDGSLRNIVGAAQQACSVAGIDPQTLSSAGAVLGLAGANVGNYARALEGRLPFGRSAVVSDALIALEGAVGDSGDGAIAILGTGTAYLVRRGGQAHAIGGWGFQVGDQASGARLGRDLLEETLLAHDGIRPASELTSDVLASFGNDPQAIVEFTLNASPGDFGSFAPRILDRAGKGDAVADDIVARAISAVEASIDALHLDASMPLSLLGGLAGFYGERLSRRFAVHLRPPSRDALGGAVLMAARLFASETAK